MFSNSVVSEVGERAKSQEMTILHSSGWEEHIEGTLHYIINSLESMVPSIFTLGSYKILQMTSG